MNHNERLRGILVNHALLFEEETSLFFLVSRAGTQISAEGVTIEEAIANFDVNTTKPIEPHWLWGRATINSAEAVVCSKCEQATFADNEGMQEHERTCWNASTLCSESTKGGT